MSHRRCCCGGGQTGCPGTCDICINVYRMTASWTIEHSQGAVVHFTCNDVWLWKQANPPCAWATQGAGLCTSDSTFSASAGITCQTIGGAGDMWRVQASFSAGFPCQCYIYWAVPITTECPAEGEYPLLESECSGTGCGWSITDVQPCTISEF